MSRHLISTGSPFERQGGYSRAVVDGDFCFVAGTAGYDYATMTIPEGVADQTRNAFRTIAKVLDESGFGVADIVRATYYIVDRANADAALVVCGEHMSEVRPSAPPDRFARPAFTSA